VPTIETVVGMHNEVLEANTDKVWAGMIVRLDDGRYQFVSVYGPRHGTIRPSYQQPSARRSAAQNKYDQMYREKLAHGYHVIDWRDHRYSLYTSIGREGNLRGAAGPLPAGASQVPAAERDPMPRRTYVSAAVEHMAPRYESEGAIAEAMTREATRRAAVDHPIEAHVEHAPDVETLAAYIRERTSDEPAPDPKPVEAQPKIRKARRLDF